MTPKKKKQDLPQKVKEQIAEAVANDLQYYNSARQHARALKINESVYSRVFVSKDFGQKLALEKWITLARKYKINIGDNDAGWKIVKTPIFCYITAQLEVCQRGHQSYMLCDFSDIGKTEAAKHYAETHKNAIYVDCSQYKTKQRFIKHISREFGLDAHGRYGDIYDNLCFWINSQIESPIIILDEWGDVSYETFMEVKALWNATDRRCSWYAIGAEGLEEKMRRGITNKKVGYTEIFSRFAKKYGKIDFEDEKLSKQDFIEMTATQIIKANAPVGSDYSKIFTNTICKDDGRPSLRRIRTELLKQ